MKTDALISTDLVSRLREQSTKWFDDDTAGIAVMREAADEIERLRALGLVTLVAAFRATVKNLPPEIRQDVVSQTLPDTSRFNGDYCNDLADMRAGWGLL